MNYYVKPKKGLMTQEIQLCIDKCSQNGGGIIYFEDGEYLTGNLYLKSDVHLKLSEQTIIRASSDINQYNLDTHKQMYARETHMDRCWIFAKDCNNISIDGGTFHGMGETFKGSRPMMFRYYKSNYIKISNVKMKNPAAWTNAFIQCDNIWVDNIEIHSRANGNGDGLDFDACENVFVKNSKFDCSDDCICVQNSTIDKKASNIFISNNVFVSKWAGIRIGLLSTFNIENIFVSNCFFKDIECSGLKIQSAEGSVVKNIICSNLVMENVRRPFFITANRYRENVDYISRDIESASEIYNTTIKDVYATGFADNNLPNCMIIDCAPGNIIKNILIKDIQYTVYGNESYINREVPLLLDTRAEAFKYKGDLPASGLFVRNATNVKCDNIAIYTINNDAREEILIK